MASSLRLLACIWCLGYVGSLVALARPYSDNRDNFFNYPNSEENEILEDPCIGIHRCNSSMDSFCHCDLKCSLYGDCCPDAPGTRNQDTTASLSTMECSSEGFFFTTKCPSNFPRNSLTKTKCENPSYHRSPYSKIPVVDTRTRLTFRNYYCAQCHGVEENSALFWNLKFSCSGVLPDDDSQGEIDLAQQLTFNEDLDSWGVWVAINSTLRSFRRCETKLTFPNITSFRYEPRTCLPGLVNSCPRQWVDRNTVQKCSRLYSPIFGTDRRRYKNVYCAVCNGAYGERGMFCNAIQPRSAVTPSFSILLDMNASADEESSSGSGECPSGHVKFGTKCKRLTCGIPGYIIHNGRCIRRRRA